MEVDSQLWESEADVSTAASMAELGMDHTADFSKTDMGVHQNVYQEDGHQRRPTFPPRGKKLINRPLIEISLCELGESRSCSRDIPTSNVQEKCNEIFNEQVRPSSKFKLINRPLPREGWHSRDLNSPSYIKDLDGFNAEAVAAAKSPEAPARQAPVIQRPVNAESYKPDAKRALMHEAGLCKPCLFRFTDAGCKHGKDCSFCHLQHQRRKWPRPSKAKRDSIKRAAGMCQ